MISQEKVFINDYIKFWFEDNILFGEYKKDIEIDIKAAKKIVEDRVSFCNNRDYPHYIVITGIKSTSKEARDYLALEGVRSMSALALITESHVSRIIGNFFMVINKPAVPTKLFTNEQEAIRWLKHFGSSN